MTKQRSFSADFKREAVRFWIARGKAYEGMPGNAVRKNRQQEMKSKVKQSDQDARCVV